VQKEGAREYVLAEIKHRKIKKSKTWRNKRKQRTNSSGMVHR
jgi:hypothetical protein